MPKPAAKSKAWAAAESEPKRNLKPALKPQPKQNRGSQP